MLDEQRPDTLINAVKLAQHRDSARGFNFRERGEWGPKVQGLTARQGAGSMGLKRPGSREQRKVI